MKKLESFYCKYTEVSDIKFLDNRSSQAERKEEAKLKFRRVMVLRHREREKNYRGP